jgi:hypothetical protein
MKAPENVWWNWSLEMTSLDVYQPINPKNPIHISNGLIIMSKAKILKKTLN